MKNLYDIQDNLAHILLPGGEVVVIDKVELDTVDSLDGEWYLNDMGMVEHKGLLMSRLIARVNNLEVVAMNDCNPLNLTNQNLFTYKPLRGIACKGKMGNPYKVLNDDATVIYVNHKGQAIHCIINTDDLQMLKDSKITWTCHGNKKYIIGKLPGTSTQVKLHRFLLGITDSSIPVDHLDRNPLNNKRNNLVLSTNRDNSYNRGIFSNNTSGIKGVNYHSGRGVWVARFRDKYLGDFRNKEDAIKARRQAEQSG